MESVCVWFLNVFREKKTALYENCENKLSAEKKKEA